MEALFSPGWPLFIEIFADMVSGCNSHNWGSSLYFYFVFLIRKNNDFH